MRSWRGKKRKANSRAFELKDELDDLYHEVMSFYIPEKEDSLAKFDRFGQALYLFQQKLRILKDSAKA